MRKTALPLRGLNLRIHLSIGTRSYYSRSETLVETRLRVWSTMQEV
jgi:hypothetical protein